MKNIFKTTLLIATVALGANAAQAETLKVGANIGNVPWEFQDKSGKNIGFEIDLVNEVAKRLQMDVEITNIPFNGLFAAVQSGQIDAAVSSITITEKRLKSVSFAQPYYDSDQSLTARSDSKVKSVDDIKGKIISVDTGSTGDIWAEANKEKTGIAEIRRYEGLSNAMLDLVAGRTDGYISDIPAMQYYTKDKPDLKVVARIKTGEQYSIMFAKNSPLQAKVNSVLTELKKEGYIAALHGKWFGSVPEKTTSTVMVMDAPKES
ncbi:transporter substrate-binding domain-containing protein [Aestuariirhabdus litorea]|nr:transporter substrate-binding domain-containing protein [Aestuariirhabdus litorea]